MRSRLTQTLFLTALVLSIAPGTPQLAYSQQNGSRVAGGGRVDRRSAHHSTPKPSPVDPATSNDEVTAGLSTSRIREIESLEQQCLDEVNRVRRARRLSRLDFYDDLLPVARLYSRRMAEERFFSHTDPDGRTVRERVDDAEIRWRMVGENLASSNGYINPVAASLHSWMDSPGHRRNILDPDFRLTAIGAWIDSDGTVYFTEIFLKQ
jgi:uncharacterized protein YkwD